MPDPRVLVVDDDPTRRQNIVALLDREFETWWAGSARHAVALIERHPFEVVVAPPELKDLVDSVAAARPRVLVLSEPLQPAELLARARRCTGR